MPENTPLAAEDATMPDDGAAGLDEAYRKDGAIDEGEDHASGEADAASDFDWVDESDTAADAEGREETIEPAEDGADETEYLDVYEDEDGNEFVIIDGVRVPFDPDVFELVEVDVDPDDESYNPFAYDSVQAATDVANDLARAGGSIAREGAALANDAAAIAGELKEAMDDINNLLNPKNWLK